MNYVGCLDENELAELISEARPPADTQPATTQRTKSLADAIAAAEKAGDYTTAIRLKTQQLYGNE